MLGESHYTLGYHKRTLYNKTNNSTEKKNTARYFLVKN